MKLKEFFSHHPRAAIAFSGGVDSAYLLWAAVNARVNGETVVYDFGEEGRATGQVTHSDPPRALVHTWNWPGLPESFVTWKIGEGNIRLTHEGLLGAEAVDYALGWHLILDELEGVESDPAQLHEYYAGL